MTKITQQRAAMPQAARSASRKAGATRRVEPDFRLTPALEQRAQTLIDNLMQDEGGGRLAAAWDDGDAAVLEPVVARAAKKDKLLYAAAMTLLFGGRLGEYLE